MSGELEKEFQHLSDSAISRREGALSPLGDSHSPVVGYFKGRHPIKCVSDLMDHPSVHLLIHENNLEFASRGQPFMTSLEYVSENFSEPHMHIWPKNDFVSIQLTPGLARALSQKGIVTNTFCNLFLYAQHQLCMVVAKLLSCVNSRMEGTPYNPTFKGGSDYEDFVIQGDHIAIIPPYVLKGISFGNEQTKRVLLAYFEVLVLMIQGAYELPYVAIGKGHIEQIQMIALSKITKGTAFYTDFESVFYREATSVTDYHFNCLKPYLCEAQTPCFTYSP
jgi:hypothetical protein